MVLRSASVLLAVAIAWSAAAATARADQGSKYVSDPAAGDFEPVYIADYRDPTALVIGFDFGLGILGGLCTGCDRDLGGLALDVFVGTQLTRRLALVADLWSILHLLPADSSADRGLATHSFATAAARFWAMPELWLQAGVGAGMFRVDGSSEDQAELAPAFTLTVGGEVDHQPTRTVSLSARLGLGLYEDDDGSTTGLYNIAAVVGWHWF